MYVCAHLYYVYCGINLMKCHFFRKLYIADARPRKNALANGAMGGGSESSSHYFQSEVCLWFELFSSLDHKM